MIISCCHKKVTARRQFYFSYTMSMFQFKWLRRFVRRHTNPIAEPSAELWKRRLSFGYALLAWNAFGFVCYMVFTGKSDWAKHHGLKTEEDMALSPAQQFAKSMNVEKAKIIRFSGFRKVEEINFENEKPEKE